MLDWLITITVTAVEIPELTEQEISDKPDGMATLTACCDLKKILDRFGRRFWTGCRLKYL
ncbi:MAG: hypothetical protein V7L30_32035 [Nostoc sp.]